MAAALGAEADGELELPAGAVAQGLGGGAAADGQRATCCSAPRRIVVTGSQASPAQRTANVRSRLAAARALAAGPKILGCQLRLARGANSAPYDIYCLLPLFN